MDKSMLTGESRLVSLNADKSSSDENESMNLGFMCTNLVEGEATAVVLRTGRRTAIGNIAHLSEHTKRKMTNLQKDMYIYTGFMLGYLHYLFE